MSFLPMTPTTSLRDLQQEHSGSSEATIIISDRAERVNQIRTPMGPVLIFVSNGALPAAKGTVPFSLTRKLGQSPPMRQFQKLGAANTLRPGGGRLSVIRQCVGNPTIIVYSMGWSLGGLGEVARKKQRNIPRKPEKTARLASLLKKRLASRPNFVLACELRTPFSVSYITRRMGGLFFH